MPDLFSVRISMSAYLTILSLASAATFLGVSLAEASVA